MILLTVTKYRRWWTKEEAQGKSSERETVTTCVLSDRKMPNGGNEDISADVGVRVSSVTIKIIEAYLKFFRCSVFSDLLGRYRPISPRRQVASYNLPSEMLCGIPRRIGMGIFTWFCAFLWYLRSLSVFNEDAFVLLLPVQGCRFLLALRFRSTNRWSNSIVGFPYSLGSHLIILINICVTIPPVVGVDDRRYAVFIIFTTSTTAAIAVAMLPLAGWTGVEGQQPFAR